MESNNCFRPFQVSGVKVYGRGTSYYHLYNVSMFKPTAVCKDTFNYRTSTRKKKLASLMGTVEGLFASVGLYSWFIQLVHC